MNGPTVDAARRELTARFKSSSIESAELDARMLAGAVLGLDLTGLISSANRRLTSDESIRLEDFARRRLGGEPVARILGAREFWGLPLKLSAATLVPRPDTETLVELALDMLRACAAPRSPAAHRRSRHRLRRDPAGAVVGTARGGWRRHRHQRRRVANSTDNAVDLGLADRADFIACDYASDLTGTFDLIVSNPPYIRSADIAGLATEVRDHDPPRALDGGRDGLDAYRALIPQAARLLAPQGVLAVEVGQGQHDDVRGLMMAAGLVPEGPAKSRSGGHPPGGRRPQKAVIKPDWKVKNLLEYSPGATTFRPQRRSRVAGPVDTLRGYRGWRPEFSEREPAPSERFQNAGQLSAMAERAALLPTAKRTKA